MKDAINQSVIDSQAIKSCWQKINSEKGSSVFVDNFYQHMFEHHPEVKSFFPENLISQKTKLLNTLNNVINGIEYIEELKDELLMLGEQHKNINIKPEMFEHFITTIIATANFASNNTLTNEELLSWEVAFRKVSDIMLEAY